MASKRDIAALAVRRGIWLHAIRAEFPSEVARKTAAMKIYNEMFNPALEVEHQKDEEKLKSIRRLASALRFICPSYYVGKLKS